jgi:hypothetical protein
MDPVSIIAGAVGQVAGVIGLTSRRANRPGRINPLDYQERWPMSKILLMGMLVLLLVGIVAIGVNAFKRK